MLWPCGGHITAAVTEVAGTAITDRNCALFMKFWKNPEAFTRGANLKFVAKKERSTAKPDKNTAKSDIFSQTLACSTAAPFPFHSLGMAVDLVLGPSTTQVQS